jgi:Rrf2 family protein
MQITRQTDYAIRCVLYVSRAKDRIVMIDEIAREMGIPKTFLAKILQKLTKTGLVKSFRGVQGGFQLAKKRGQISLLDVITAIQGLPAMNRCAVDRKTCQLSSVCAVHPVWLELRKKVEQHLRKITFEKLA